MNTGRRYAAVIFDLDGVLADSEPAHLQAINNVLARYGCRLSDAEARAQMGLGLEDCLRMTIEATGVGLTPDRLAREYNAELLDVLSRGSEPLPGTIELVARLRELGVPIAVASSSMPAWIEATLAGLGLSGQFEAVVSGETVARPKPAPDIYLQAADLIGVPAHECMAIEDTPAGLTSAKAAGMYAIQVRSSSTAFPPQPHADLVIDSLEDFDVRLLASA